jgi:hypothetical protein
MEMNESLYIALGLKTDSAAEQAVVTASELSEIKRKVLQITKTDNATDALGILQANALAAERYQAAEAKLHALEQAQAEKDFDSLAKEGDRIGKLTPAMAKSEWAQELRAKGSSGVQELKSFLQHAPVVVSRKPVIEETDELQSVELSESEIAVNRKFVGDDPVALKKRCDAIRAQKLEDIRMRKAGHR